MNASQVRPDRKMWSGTFRVLLAESLLLPTGLLTAAYLTRTLGPGLYGLLTLVSVLIGWLEWGITSVFSRTTIKLAGEQEDWRPIGTLALRLHLLASLGCTLLIWLLAGPIAEQLHEPKLEFFLRLLSLDIPLFCLAATHRDLLIAKGAFRERAVASAWRWLSKLVIVVGLVELGLSIEGALIGAIVSSLIELVVCRYYVRPSLFQHIELPIRKALDYALPLFLFAVAMQLYDRLDLILLKVLGGTNEMAGYFGAAQNLSIVPGLFALSFSPLLLSTLSRLGHEGGREEAQDVLRNALRLTTCLLPFAALAAGCAPEAVTLLFGATFAPVAPIFSILIFGAGGLVMISVATASLTATGRPGLTFLLTGPMVPLAVIAHLIVIPKFGPIGAAWVTTAGTLLGALVTLVAVARIWDVLPPLYSSLRSLLISALIYLAAVLVPATGAVILLELLVLAAMIPLAYWALGELSSSELQLLRLKLRNTVKR